jgi:peptide/nickel transport system permease protein
MKYVLLRLILVLPTVLIVCVIAFFMSRAVPGDQADAVLQLRGVNPEFSQGDNPEYSNVYISEKLHMPLFYFSVLPDFYPENIRSVTNKYRRNTTIVLLHQKYPFRSIQQFLDERDSFVKLMSVQLNSHDNKSKESGYVLNVDSLNQALYILSGMQFAEKPDDITEALKQLEGLMSITLTQQSIALKDAVQNMNQTKRKYYYPKLYWHGTQSQFHQWISGMLKLEMGVSMRDGQPVWNKIVAAMKWTLTLLLLNLFFTLTISVPVGIYSGRFPGTLFDKWTGITSIALYSIPVFWLASMLIIFFTTSDYGMKIFDISGIYNFDGSTDFLSALVRNADHLILPVICLVLNDIAYLSRLVRSGFLREKTNLYGHYARTKGLAERDVAYKHIFPNTLIPLVTIIAGSIPSALAGTLVVEVIFNIPGMGRLMHSSIFSADWNVVFAVLVVISIVTALILLLADLMYARLNPKIKPGGDGG